jgi:N-acetylglucosamine kinase-like BadF-type ATPase
MLILAMDIGKTKTLAVLVDEGGNVYGRALSGPSGMWLMEERVVKNVRQAIEGCLAYEGIKHEQVDVISISWADLDTREDWQNAWNVVKKIGLQSERVIIEHDVVSAYYTVTWGEPGVAVIAGTGSIAYGVNKYGEKMIASGWGWLIGDEGSAYWIAIRALNAVSRAYDGRGEQTLLTDKVKKVFFDGGKTEILTKIYKEMKGDPTEIAKMAKIVDEAAAEGDKIAVKILSEAGRELAECVLAIARGLRMENDDIIVGGVGGVFRSKIVNETFNKILRIKLPNARIRGPFIGDTPIIGPIIIALKKRDMPITTGFIDKIMKNIEQE